MCQSVYSYNYTKNVSGDGVVTKGASADQYYYFAFNGNVAYESDENGNATYGNLGAYHYVGTQDGCYVYEYRYNNMNNPFIAGMVGVGASTTGISSKKLLVTTDYSVVNICNFNSKGGLVSTWVYNYKQKPTQGEANVPQIIR